MTPTITNTTPIPVKYPIILEIHDQHQSIANNHHYEPWLIITTTTKYYPHYYNQLSPASVPTILSPRVWNYWNWANVVHRYLFNHTIKVCYKGTFSAAQPILCGVPQGSILGPHLFLLHFNEVPTLLALQNLDVRRRYRYILYYHRNDLHSIEKALSEDLNTVSTWLQQNELILNLKKGKTEIMLFGTKARLNKQNHKIEVEYQLRPMNVTESLGY